MIRDPSVLAQTKSEWASVQATRQSIDANLAAGHIGLGSVGTSHAFKNLAFGLWLLFAFSVFERVLVQLRSEGVFTSKSLQLGHLMEGSKSALPWRDYALVDEARQRRNDVAHRMAVFERVDIWRYVEAIESELNAWAVL
jgi:hypothetical protein